MSYYLQHDIKSYKSLEAEALRLLKQSALHNIPSGRAAHVHSRKLGAPGQDCAFEVDVVFLAGHDASPSRFIQRFT